MSFQLEPDLEPILRGCSSSDEAQRAHGREELRGFLARHATDRPLLKKNPRPRLRPSDERIHNDQEVNEGFTVADALLEANRCLMCKSAACRIGIRKGDSPRGGCPVGLRIPEFINAFREGDIREAYRILAEDNPLHRITARVCPQDEQCQASCSLARIGSVSIGLLERMVGDLYERLYGKEQLVNGPVCQKDFPVALVGSGPAALTAAIYLVRLGHRSVHVFEAFHEAGGVLRYGIPAFRLPRAILDEIIAYVKGLGVIVHTDVAVGRTFTMGDLKRMGFRAVFLGTGAGLPVFMRIPGEELNGVISANEFLTRCNLMSADSEGFDTPVQVGRKTVVIGGGNVAMDAARWARRIAAKRYGANQSQVIVVYRRTRQDMPARSEEIEHAAEEGVQFMFLSSPVSFLEGPAKGSVGAVQCQKMVIAGEGSDGRNQIVAGAGEGSVFQIENVDTVIEALGTKPNALLSRQNKGLEEKEGRIVVTDEKRGTTTVDGVFAGGDAARGGATVILAMGDGKNAAFAIHDYLQMLTEAPSRPDSRLLNASEWFRIIRNDVRASGRTKDGRDYAIREMVVYAPLIADAAKAGQFVMVMADKMGERVPLTLADWDSRTGTIHLVFQEIGVSTYKLGRLQAGMKLFSALGPLGHPSDVGNTNGKAVVIVGGGVGIAPVFPIARAHREAGSPVIGIIGARNSSLMFWEERMRGVSDQLYLTFDDKGEFVTHALERVLRSVDPATTISHIVAVGPVVMMENVYKTASQVCRDLQIAPVKVVISLNPTMMDGTGMCGGCRLLVKGSAKYGCVDGPEFDASLVDFETMKNRQAVYRGEERKALDTYMNNFVCAEQTLSSFKSS